MLVIVNVTNEPMFLSNVQCVYYVADAIVQYTISIFALSKIVEIRSTYPGSHFCSGAVEEAFKNREHESSSLPTASLGAG